MFETAEVGNKLSKAEFAKASPELRKTLLAAQKALAESKTAVVLLLGGVEGAGKAETVNRLLEWMDARGVETHVMVPLFEHSIEFRGARAKLTGSGPVPLRIIPPAATVIVEAKPWGQVDVRGVVSGRHVHSAARQVRQL